MMNCLPKELDFLFSLAHRSPSFRWCQAYYGSNRLAEPKFAMPPKSEFGITLHPKFFCLALWQNTAERNAGRDKSSVFVFHAGTDQQEELPSWN
jgi:hypothetical protein